MAGVGPVRNRKKQAWWRRIVRGQAGSGLSVRAYCAQHGVKESGYYWWRSQLARRDAEPPPPLATFVPVTVAGPTPASTSVGRLEIVLPGHRRVRVMGPVDQRMLADVLTVLTAREGGVAC